jgi:hypothetical protein
MQLQSLLITLVRLAIVVVNLVLGAICLWHVISGYQLPVSIDNQRVGAKQILCLLCPNSGARAFTTHY